MRIGGLFEGYGGLTMAVQAVLGGDLAWYSEIASAPAKVLAHHHAGIPNLGDIAVIDWDAVEPVDILAGGFPCQDVSLAGQRAGMKPDTRSGLWSHMAYAIKRLRPKLVVVENVRGLLSAKATGNVEPCPWCLGDGNDKCVRALGTVLADLASLGYDAVWCGLRAAAVGTPHGRYRVFIVAADAQGERHGDTWPASLGGVPATPVSGDQRDATADALRGERDGGWSSRRWRTEPTNSGAPVADTESDGRREGGGRTSAGRAGT